MKFRYILLFFALFLWSVNKYDAFELEDGVYAISSYMDDSKVVSLDNSKAVLKTFTYDDNQKWKVEKKDNYYLITNVMDENKYLSDINRWIIETNDDYYNIFSFDDLSLDVKNLKTIDGTDVVLWEKNGGKNQKFNFFKIEDNKQVIEDGIYVINSYYGSNLSVGAEGLNSGDNIYLAETNSSYLEAFKIKYMDGYYNISLYGNGDLYLNNNNGNVEVGIKKNWVIRKNTDDTYGVCDDNNYCLDIYGAVSKVGTNIQMYKSNGGKNQKFIFKRVSFPSLEDSSYVISSVDSDMVVAVDNYVGANEINIHLEKFKNENKQKWRFKNIKDNIYEIESELDRSFVFDVYKEYDIKGTNIQLFQNHGSLNQRWYVMMLEDGTYHITNVNSNKNLDIYGGNIIEGSNIVQWENHYENSEKFKLKKTDVKESKQIIDNGKYLIYSLINLNKNIRSNYINDVEGSNLEMINIIYDNGYYYLKNNDGFYTNDNGRLVLSKDHSTFKQKWFLRKEGNSYIFYSKFDGKVIDVPNFKVTNGTKILTWEYNGGINQMFYLEEVVDDFLDNDFYKIKTDDKFLSIDGDIPYNKTQILFKEEKNDDSQKWYLKKIKDNLYEIRYGINRGKVIDVFGNYKNDGTNLITYNYNNGDNQKWFLIHLKNGQYKFISKSSHKFLTYSGEAKIFSHMNEKQSFDVLKTNKISYYKTVEEGYYTINSKVSSNKVIDVYRANIEKGTRIILCQKNDGLNQVWKFKYVGDGMYNIISALNPKRYLTNSNGNVQIGKGGDYDNQKWYIDILDNESVNIISVIDGLFLTLFNGTIYDETKIVVNEYSDNDAYKFVLNKYGEKKIYKGLDISKWQGNIDFNLLASENPGFIIMRVGRGIRDLGKDIKFDLYYEKANSYDIPVGVYLYSFASNLNEAKEEANYVISWLAERYLDLPVFYDMEYSGQLYLGKEVLTKIAEEFCKNIISNNYNCGIYANVYWLTNFIDGKELSKNYPIWLAHWTGASTYSSGLLNEYKSGYNLSQYQYWQFTDKGKLSGITENTVDLDFGYDIFD